MIDDTIDLEAGAIEQDVAVEQEVVDTQQAPEATPDQGTKEYNFRELRKAKEQAEYERQSAIRERDELRAYILSQNQERPKSQKEDEQEDEDVDIDGDDDAYAEVRNVRRVHKGVRNVKQELKQTKKEIMDMVTEIQLKTKYPDLEEVTSKENLALLRAKKPSLAKSIAANPDYYSQLESAYDAVRDHIIGQKTNAPSYDKEKERIANNLAKPRPAISDTTRPGKSPLSQAEVFSSGLTDDVMRAMRKEMDEARNNWS